MGTGGAGFLGSYLCERLLAGGAIVICVDNFFTSACRNVEHLLDHRRSEPCWSPPWQQVSLGWRPHAHLAANEIDRQSTFCPST